MEFEGTVKKDSTSKLWIIEVSALDIMTQGTSKKDAVFMLKDAVRELMTAIFSEKATKDLCLDVHFHGLNTFGISASNSKLLIALAHHCSIRRIYSSSF